MAVSSQRIRGTSIVLSDIDDGNDEVAGAIHPHQPFSVLNPSSLSAKSMHPLWCFYQQLKPIHQHITLPEDSVRSMSSPFLTGDKVF